MTRVGDRLERAIEDRTHPEQEIARGEAAAPPRRRLVRTVFWLAVTAVSLYLVAPSLVEVFGSWNNLNRLAPAWLLAMAVLQAGSLACLWALQRRAMRAP